MSRAARRRMSRAARRRMTPPRLGAAFGTPLCTALLLVLCVWGVRLTVNWAVGWPGMHHEDWRYLMLYECAQLPRWLVQLGGVELFPTLVIFRKGKEMERIVGAVGRREIEQAIARAG